MGAEVVRVIIQSRMSSSRLPGKALLPVAGMPAVVLAARRAANTGRQVLVATSDTAADDLLARTVRTHGLACVRGSHDDVLGRFAYACADLPAQAAIVRLTADNVFPDGEFVERALARFSASGERYWSVRHPEDGLPYGMSAEITTAGMLRAAAAGSTEPYEREHVTPWIRRHAGNAGAAGWMTGFDHLRCTLDDAADYIRLAQVFDGVGAPLTVAWTDLCARLRSIEGIPPSDAIASPTGVLRFCLGTAQLGLDYGFVNASGMPNAAMAGLMVHAAVDRGVMCLDTARAYGTSEAVVGEAIRALPAPVHPQVITKLDPLHGLADDVSDAELAAAIDGSLAASCRDLGTDTLDTLLLHRWTHFRAFGGRLWRHLEALLNQGRVCRLGASVYSPQDALDALGVPTVTHLQVPFNIMDPRLLDAGVEAALERRGDVTVHARSVFLQGLLIAPADHWPRIGGVNPAHLVELLDAIAIDAGFGSRAQLCVAYALSQPWIQRLVIGCDNEDQLRANLDLFDCRLLSATELARIRARIPESPDALLDPSRWPPKSGALP